MDHVIRASLLLVVGLVWLSSCQPQIDGGTSPRDGGNDGDTGATVDGSGDSDAGATASDEDGDGISDAEEGRAARVDTDEDGTPDSLDHDSDADGISDAEEAGDEDVFTTPVDTDEDGICDFRDPDSDDDGVSDLDENAIGSDPRDSDTDDDGVTDLVEVAACPEGDTSCLGDILDDTSSPLTRGDFVFLEPHGEPPTPDEDSLLFSTTLRRADVYLLMDTTFSMGAEIANLKSAIAETIIPAIVAQIPEAWIGLGRYDDYPYGDNGYAPLDVPYEHLQALTDDDAAVTAAVNTMITHSGRDIPESAFSAMYAAVTGNALTWPSGGPVPAAAPSCDSGEYGYACFRSDAVPVIVNFTDVQQHNGPAGYVNAYSFSEAPTYATVLAALEERHVRVLWVDSQGGDYGSRATGRIVATDTGAVDPATGDPLVYPISDDGTGLTDAVVDGIRAVSGIPLDISAAISDDPSDDVDAVAAFVDHVEAEINGADVDDDGVEDCAAWNLADVVDTDADGVLDTFLDVPPGTPVCFRVLPKQNDTVEPTDEPQFFTATIDVLGDGYTPLDSRNVYFLVPPRIDVPTGPR